MAEQQTAAERIADLETELRRHDDKIKELTAERDEAREFADKMREHVDDANQLLDRCIEVFEMQQDEHGVWIFEPQQNKLWEEHDELWKQHNALVREWNKFVSQYNAVVSPRDIGRPLAASEAQKADVLKRRKKGDSLRAIVAATGLSLRTVRTIIDNKNGTGRTGKRRQELRRKEFARQRAAAYRARNKARDSLPKQITELQKAGEGLVKAAKGLGR